MRILLTSLLLVVVGCTSTPVPTGAGPLPPDTVDILERNLHLEGRPRAGDLERLGTSGDARVAWPLVDLLRFEPPGERHDETVAALVRLTGEEPPESDVDWVFFQDLLLERDVPAPPDYLRFKRGVHRAYEPRWTPFFVEPADLDWRQVSWGGVPRDGIPALVDLLVERVADSSWLNPSDVVFVVTVDGEQRAYPQRVMDVHELANDTLGGRRIAVPYCTLCGAAIAFVVEGLPGVEEPLEMHTSGLLVRSNKLMYDRQTESLWEQFSGVAVTGPLRGTRLERVDIATTTWGEWAPANPDATVLAKPRDIPRGLGDPYDGTLLDDRDTSRPIFPVGEVDDRLPAMTRVLGVETDEGTVAFPVDEATAALAGGGSVTAGGVELLLVDGALVARSADGTAVVSHQAFWFAWSQFHPGTEVGRP